MEIYSNRGNYETLRKIAPHLILQESKHAFLSGSDDLNFDFIRSLPQFATDL